MTRIISFPIIAYPSVCDSQQPPSPPTVPVAEDDACRLEEQYVHQVYEEISSDFSSTRHSPWPHVRDFLLSLPPGSILADIGCGNGKYLGINPEVISVSNIPQQSLLGSKMDLVGHVKVISHNYDDFHYFKSFTDGELGCNLLSVHL